MITVNSCLMRYSQAGKATVFGAVIRWFESSYRNYYLVATGDVFVSYKRNQPKMDGWPSG